jgi:urease gamma subunit
MRLTQRELDRTLIWSVAEMARRRRARGLRLNYPEAVGLICDEVMERARDGASYEACEAHGLAVLTRDDVLDGVAELVDLVEVEVDCEDGTKLLALRNPIR